MILKLWCTDHDAAIGPSYGDLIHLVPNNLASDSPGEYRLETSALYCTGRVDLEEECDGSWTVTVLT